MAKRGRAIRTAAEGAGVWRLRLVEKGRSRLALAALVGLLSLTATVPAGARSSARVGPVGLPPGWELCVLQGVGAPVTSANVADLDEWQVAEGGSTANDVAFNPFNTRRSTDQADAPLPATFTAAGFPAFRSWAAGCAATVATVLQTNMAPIAEALVAGGVAPPGAFLAAVDQTQWCAPSNGVPCYLSFISGPVVQTVSSAMALYRSTAAALGTYDGDVRAASAVQASLDTEHEQFAVDDIAVSFAEYAAQRARLALQRAAVYEYTSSPSLDQVANLLAFSAPTERDLLGQLYGRVDLDTLVGRYRQARTSLGAAQAGRQAVAAQVTRTTTALASARDAVSQVLARADLELVALQAAGACAGAAGPGAATSGDGAQLAALRACVGALGA